MKNTFILLLFCSVIGIGCNKEETPVVLVSYTFDKGISGEYESIQIYPNPCTNFVNISFVETGNKEVVVGLFNRKGNFIKDFIPIDTAPGSYNITVDVSALRTGIYRVEMTSDKKTALSKDILIVR